MNKQELIKEFEEIGIYGLNMFGTVVKGIPTETAIDLIKQLDEPKPVKVPQCVADWYEENKDDFEFNVWDWIGFSKDPEKIENKEFNDWINNCKGNPIQTLVNMHQFGYEVEKEKRYIAIVKGNIKENMLVYGKVIERYFFTKSYTLTNANYAHTRKELEDAGFGWVFDCPGIELEEVE